MLFVITTLNSKSLAPLTRAAAFLAEACDGDATLAADLTQLAAGDADRFPALHVVGYDMDDDMDAAHAARVALLQAAGFLQD